MFLNKSVTKPDVAVTIIQHLSSKHVTVSMVSLAFLLGLFISLFVDYVITVRMTNLKKYMEFKLRFSSLPKYNKF